MQDVDLRCNLLDSASCDLKPEKWMLKKTYCKHLSNLHKHFAPSMQAFIILML